MVNNVLGIDLSSVDYGTLAEIEKIVSNVENSLEVAIASLGGDAVKTTSQSR